MLDGPRVPDGGCQVENHVSASDRSSHSLCITHIALNELDLGKRVQVTQISRNQVVQDDYLVFLFYQEPHNVRADKASASRHQRLYQDLCLRFRSEISWNKPS